MNNFALVKEFRSYNKIRYYSIVEEGDNQIPEVEKFFEKLELEEDGKVIEEVNTLVEWIETIGNEHGAKENFFRSERYVEALPPPFKVIDEHLNIRLYCYVVSDNIVILYNGGIKTARTAQKCPNVSNHFYNALNWTKQLLEIGIEIEGDTIRNIEDLYIRY